jgi:peptidylprolyl isomerase
MNKKLFAGTAAVTLIALAGWCKYGMVGEASNGTAAASAASTSPSDAGELASKKAHKVVTTKSGLKYVDLVVGKGPSPKPGQSVTVNYLGTFADGAKFDASADHGGTFTFTIGEGQVIKGWDEGVMSMKVGGKRDLIVPPNLGYGPNGAPPVIPPNATLHFRVDLISIQ